MNKILSPSKHYKINHPGATETKYDKTKYYNINNKLFKTGKQECKIMRASIIRIFFEVFHTISKYNLYIFIYYRNVYVYMHVYY